MSAAQGHDHAGLLVIVIGLCALLVGAGLAFIAVIRAGANPDREADSDGYDDDD